MKEVPVRIRFRRTIFLNKFWDDRTRCYWIAFMRLFPVWALFCFCEQGFFLKWFPIFFFRWFQASGSIEWRFSCWIVERERERESNGILVHFRRWVYLDDLRNLLKQVVCEQPFFGFNFFYCFELVIQSNCHFMMIYDVCLYWNVCDPFGSLLVPVCICCVFYILDFRFMEFVWFP